MILPNTMPAIAPPLSNDGEADELFPSLALPAVLGAAVDNSPAFGRVVCGAFEVRDQERESVPWVVSSEAEQRAEVGMTLL